MLVQSFLMIHVVICLSKKTNLSLFLSQWRMFVNPTPVTTEAHVLQRDLGTCARAQRTFRENSVQVILLHVLYKRGTNLKMRCVKKIQLHGFINWVYWLKNRKYLLTSYWNMTSFKLLNVFKQVDTYPFVFENFIKRHTGKSFNAP